jgi:hypothetical protein
MSASAYVHVIFLTLGHGIARNFPRVCNLCNESLHVSIQFLSILNRSSDYKLSLEFQSNVIRTYE